jgi:uncharacterized protein with HEPN domain
MRDERVYLARILELIDGIEGQSAGGRSNFFIDELASKWVASDLRHIAHLARKISVPTRSLAPNFPWARTLKWGRYSYGCQSYEQRIRLWTVVQRDLPELRRHSRGLLLALHRHRKETGDSPLFTHGRPFHAIVFRSTRKPYLWVQEDGDTGAIFAAGNTMKQLRSNFTKELQRAHDFGFLAETGYGPGLPPVIWHRATRKDRGRIQELRRLVGAAKGDPAIPWSKVKKKLGVDSPQLDEANSRDPSPRSGILDIRSLRLR